MSRRTVEDWRRAVYRARVSGNVQVLLLLMADHMRTNLIVSVPRSRLAQELGIHEQRVAERIKTAVEHEWLFRNAGGYRGRTAEYRAMFPGERVRELGTQSDAERVRPTSTHSTPEIGTHSTDECVPDGGYAITTADLPGATADRNASSNEQGGCRWHGHAACPDDCADHPSTRQESA